METKQLISIINYAVKKQIVIKKGAGWIFGDISLLFNSYRTASIQTATTCILWALNKVDFMKFVMKHAKGARLLRFVRKTPLLKTLADNKLIAVANVMREVEYRYSNLDLQKISYDKDIIIILNNVILIIYNNVISFICNNWTREIELSKRQAML